MRKFDKFSFSMRSSLICLCSAVLLFVPSGANAQQANITVNFRNESFTSAIRYLETNYGYDFTYRTEDVSTIPAITFSLRNASINAVMSRILDGSALTYRVNGKSVVISKSETAVVFYQGRVTDTHGNPLSGATVLKRGTLIGAITDAQGVYRMRVSPGETPVFVYSYLGYKTSERQATNTNMPVVALEEDTAQIEQVIVTGFGNMGKGQYTGAANVVKADDVLQTASFSIDQMLAGEIPGMSVIQGSGEASATPKIRIRGTSTIAGQKSPLWVINGIPLEDPVDIDYSDLNSDEAAYLVGSAISFINPQDIESITVLKDAAAASLYGARAANGVIVVELKKGRKGTPTVSYSGGVSVRMRENYRSRNLMNATERIQLSQDIMSQNLLYYRDQSSFGYEKLYYDFLNKDLSLEEFDREVQKMARRNTDWYDLLYKNTLSHNHTVKMSGGTDTNTYYASLGYNSTAGPGRNSDSERYTALVTLTSRINKNLNVELSLDASQVKNNGYHASVDIGQFARETSRTIPAYNDDGSYFFYSIPRAFGTGLGADQLLHSPLNELEQTGASGETTSAKASLKVVWNIGAGFDYELLGSYSTSNSNETEWATDKSYYVAQTRNYDYGSQEPGSSREQSSALGMGGIITNGDSRKTTYMVRNKIGYKKSIGEHNMVFDFFHTVSSTRAKGFSSTGWGWMDERGGKVSPIIGNSNVSHFSSTGAAKKALRPDITDYEKNSMSYLVMGEYSFRNKYSLSASARMEGSNSFGDNPKYRFRPIWSFGARYNIHEEEFLKNSQVIDRLSLRASFGLQGNVDTGSSPDLIVQLGAYNADKGFYESTVAYYPNPDLRWEKTKQYNIGLEAELWKNRISIGVDYYAKYTKDLIVSSDISQVNGIQKYKFNTGDMENKGVEVGLSVTPVITKDFTFKVGVNYAYNKNKITKASLPTSLTKAQWVSGDAVVEGVPFGSMYSYHFAYLDHNTGLPVFYEKDPVTGKLSSTWIRESDGQEFPNYTVYTEYIDLVRSGIGLYQGDPPHKGGISLLFRYKNLSLTTKFTYGLGAVSRLPNIVNGQANRVFDSYMNVTKDMNDRWRQPGDEKHTNIPALFNLHTYNSLPMKSSVIGEYPDFVYARPGSYYYDDSNIRIVSADNLKLSNISLKYRLPERISQRYLGLKFVSMDFQVSNLFILADKAWNGFDPEMGRNASVTPPKSYSLSLNVNF